MKKMAVFVCCDGLGIDWVTPERTSAIYALAQQSLWCPDHHSVFPSVTRVSAASVATGCYPARHGLHGNRMALREGEGFTVRDVGKPDFRDHMRRATGGTLKVPTLAERAAVAGGFVGFSNVSPGAAYFLDPENFGHVHHRAGSFGPGGRNLEPLAVTHDTAGDAAMTARFCEEVLLQCKAAVAILWLTDPDHTLHGAPLGSPQHLAALRGADECVGVVAETVARLRRQGTEILLGVGSDHGQETIGGGVDLDEWLARQALAGALATGAVAVAGQGTAALLYATSDARPALEAVLDQLRMEPWVDDVIAGEGLYRLGFAPNGGVVAAVNMGRQADVNDYGVPGRRWTVIEEGKLPVSGWGQHGGWGPAETRPFLLLNAPELAAGNVERRTALVDIAPTLLDFLGLPADSMDGRSLFELSGSERASTV